MKEIILGTGVSSSKDYEGLLNVVREAIKNGIYSFDTAPSYRTDNLLGEVISQVLIENNLSRSDLFIQTKIDAWQMQEMQGEIAPYVYQALKEMKLDYFDSLLIHWPLPEFLETTWQSFVQLYKEGVVKKIGICNVRLRQLKQFLSWNFVPQVIQIERNPLRVCEQEINFCKEHGIEVQAYSPLCKMDSRIRDNKMLADLSAKYHKNIGQIVLRWHIQSGVTPVFTSTKPKRVNEYANIDDFSLTEDECKKIASLNENYKMYLESWSCPGF